MTTSTDTHVNYPLGNGASLAEIEDFVERQPIPEETAPCSGCARGPSVRCRSTVSTFGGYR